jgi:hypothetical protein
VKPRLTIADQRAYQLVESLKYGQEVYIGVQRAFSAGIEGSVPVFRIKGRNVRIQAGDPRLLELRAK